MSNQTVETKIFTSNNLDIHYTYLYYLSKFSDPYKCIFIMFLRTSTILWVAFSITFHRWVGDLHSISLLLGCQMLKPGCHKFCSFTFNVFVFRIFLRKIMFSPFVMFGGWLKHSQFDSLRGNCGKILWCICKREFANLWRNIAETM